MRNRIFPVVLSCLATSLLVACPQVPQAPSSAREPTAAPPAALTPMSESEAASTPSPDAKGKRGAGQPALVAWRAFGTEPFWQVRVDGDDLYFSTPEDPDGRLMHGRRTPSLVGLVYVGRDGEKDFTLDIGPGECSDGMSDNRYEYKSTFVYGGTTYKGCGEAAK